MVDYSILDQGQQIFSVKDQMVNIFGFLGHMVSVIATQLCHYSGKAAIVNIVYDGVAVFQKSFIYRNRSWAGFGLWALVCPLLF